MPAPTKAKKKLEPLFFISVLYRNSFDVCLVCVCGVTNAQRNSSNVIYNTL